MSTSNEKPAQAAWRPPDKPDPKRILQEAFEDAHEGRHETALAKHEWFHEHALRYQPAQYGVRRSFALSAWASLGVAYPPALDSLRRLREQAIETCRASGSPEAFHDFASINGYLQEPARTVEAFLALDAARPELARAAYWSAESALIAAGRYEVCGRYIDPEKTWNRLLRQFRMTRGDANATVRDATEQIFSAEVATLVALLTLNRRREEAVRIAEAARAEWDDPAFAEVLQRALEGVLPPPLY